MQPSEAFQALNLFLGWEAPWIPVYGGGNGRKPDAWHRADGNLAPAVLATTCGRYEEAYLGHGQRSVDNGPTTITVLWAKVAGAEQVKAAHKFRPLPTLVLREGSSSRRLLMWALRCPVSYQEAHMANRKIAYRLRSKQKDGLPEALRVPAPGMPVGRGVVEVSRLAPVAYSLQEVTGRLKEPPQPTWKEGR